MKPLGKAFLLYYEDPDNPGEYLPLANCRSNSKSTNNEMIDVTDKDGMPDRELIKGGIRSRDISASGVMSDAASVALMMEWVDGGEIKNFRQVDGLGNTTTGPYLCQSFEHAGEFDGEQTYDIKLASAGAATLVYAP